jgi:alpha-L-fucosidase
MIQSYFRHRIAVSLLLLGTMIPVLPTHAAEPAPETPQQKAARLAWWKSGKLGLFLHWGAYSQEGGSYKGQGTDYHEWLMLQAKIPIKEFEKYAAGLNPVKFNADAWVRAAKDAGMTYIVITTKHHDGFAMYHSASDKFNIVDGTSFKRDPMKELADACKRHGLKFCVYYSLGRDWHDPDVPTNYPVKAGRSNTWDFPDEDAKVFSRYFERKVKPQVRELLTGYGPIGVMWFDTPELIPRDESRELREMILTLQPACIINDRIGNGQGDFRTSEQKLLGDISRSPWEACMTMAKHWSYNKFDTWKTSDTIIQSMVDSVSKGGNFLINVGPDGQGTFPSEATERLTAMGRWMRVNGESIYGTEPWQIYGEGSEPTKPSPEAATAGAPKAADVVAAKDNQYTARDFRFTTKNGILYVIGFGWPADGKWNIKSLAENSAQYPGKIKEIKLLGARDAVRYSRDSEGLKVTLPAKKPCESAYVLKIIPDFHPTPPSNL